MNTRLIFLLLLASVTLLRWMWGGMRELSAEEAYLALCGFTPAPAYFDGPPGTPVTVAAGLQIAGGGLGASFFWPLFAAVASLSMYALAVPVAGPRGALGLAVLLNLLPAFNQAALVPTSALPVTMFSLAFMAAAWRALERQSGLWWLAAGLAGGGALLFAYDGLFLLPAMAAVLLASHRWRARLLTPGMWAAALPVLGVLSLLVWWNAGHGWVHFIRGTWQTAVTLQWSLLPGMVGAAVAGVSPFVFAALAAAFIFAGRGIRDAPKAKFLAVPAVAALAAAAYAGLHGHPAATPGLTAAALSLPLLLWLPRLPYLSTFMFVGAAAWTAFDLVRQPLSPPTITTEVGARIQELQAAQTTDSSTPVFLIASHAPLASALALYLPDLSFAEPGHPPVYVVESPYSDSQYALWPRYDQFVDAPPADPAEAPDPFTEQDGANPFVGRSALYITDQKPEQLPQAITAAFGAHRLLAEIATPSGLLLRVYLCEEYETLPL
jgi:hypothetical protein